jgi:hypothetical protein
MRLTDRSQPAAISPARARFDAAPLWAKDSGGHGHDGPTGFTGWTDRAEYGSLGLPQPSSDPQVGALLLTAKSGYAFAAGAIGEKTVADAPEGSLGTHGYISSDAEIQALFIASGRGIKPGVKLQSVDNVDVAPTAAKLLGVELKNVDGKALTEILQSR